MRYTLAQLEPHLSVPSKGAGRALASTPTSNGHAHGQIGYPGTDQELIRAASSAKNGEKFRQLYSGDTSGNGGDDSGADLALCNILAYWTGGDEARIDRIFRGSGLYRDKWDREDYRAATIGKAIADARKFYEPARSHPTVGIPGAGHADPSPEGESSTRFVRTDTGNAERFAAMFGDRVRYVKAWKKWPAWTGVRWQKDETGEVERMGKEAVRSIYVDAASEEDADVRAKLVSWAQASEHVSRRAAMLTLAQSEPPISIAPTDLDRDLWLFNTMTGTIDLRTGELRPHDPKDLITKLAPIAYDPAAACPEYERFVRRIFAADEALIEYVERLIGYGLTGDIRHHHLPIAWGDGQNGKSTLFDLVLYILGDYAGPAPDSLLTSRTHDEHATEVANLQGLRLIIATETDENRKLRIGMVKKLTGDAKLIGRFMRCDFFSFDRTHKTVLVSNNRPRVTEDSTAVWRRLRLIPFTVTIPAEEQDAALPLKLRDEAPGILARWVRACLRWQADGFSLAEPQAVTEATADYRENEDVLGDWLASDCILGEGYKASRQDIWQAYQRWAERTHIPHPLAQHGLYEKVRRVPGVTEVYVMAGGRSRRGFEGIGVALGASTNVF